MSSAAGLARPSDATSALTRPGNGRQDLLGIGHCAQGNKADAIRERVGHLVSHVEGKTGLADAGKGDESDAILAEE